MLTKGVVVIKWNLRAQAFRKKYLTRFATIEVLILAAGTALLCYPNMFLRIDMTEAMEQLFAECSSSSYNHICEYVALNFSFMNDQLAWSFLFLGATEVDPLTNIAARRIGCE